MSVTSNGSSGGATDGTTTLSDAEVDNTVDEPAKQPRRYRGRTPDERKVQRRRRLLDAALELFATAGYARTSVERLCSTSGVTGRHFYEEFPSREALLEALFDDIVVTALERTIDAVASAPPDTRLRLRAGVGTYIHHLLDDPRRARIVAIEVVGVSPALEAHRRSLGRRFAAFLTAEAEQLRAAGARISAGNEFTAILLVAMVHELTVLWLESEDRASTDDLVDEAVRIMLAVARSDELDSLDPT
jgi:AcrR family transcriptional regulator